MFYVDCSCFLCSGVAFQARPSILILLPQIAGREMPRDIVMPHISGEEMPHITKRLNSALCTIELLTSAEWELRKACFWLLIGNSRDVLFQDLYSFSGKEEQSFMTSVETETIPCHLCFGKLLLQPNTHERRGSIDCYHQLYKTPDMFCNSPLNSNNTTLWAKMSNERCQDECVPRFCAYGWFQFWDFLTVARNLSSRFWYKTRMLKEQSESCAARTPTPLNFCF